MPPPAQRVAQPERLASSEWDSPTKFPQRTRLRSARGKHIPAQHEMQCKAAAIGVLRFQTLEQIFRGRKETAENISVSEVKDLPLDLAVGTRNMPERRVHWSARWTYR